MHFVYKLDNLFRSIRVRTKTHLLQRPALHFSRLFCGWYAPFKSTSSTLHPFWHHLLFFMHLLICFELNDPEIEKHYKWTLKRLKLSVVSSFHPHSMCKKVERSTAKTRWTSCTNCTISFEVSGFGRKLICYKGRHFIFLNLLQLQTFLHSVCTIESHVITFQPFVTSFVIFHAFADLFWAKWP